MDPKVTVYREGEEIVFEANRDGMKWISDMCLKLAGLSDEEAETPANHYHISEAMNNAEKGSIPAVLQLNKAL